jgi:cell wall-associated NlpC family hydrolase
VPPPKVGLARPIRHGTKGADVVAVKRALSRAGFMRWGGFTQMWGPGAEDACKAFQKAHKLQQTGNYGPKTHAALVNVHKRGDNKQFAWDDLSVRMMAQFLDELEHPDRKIRKAIVAAAFYWNSKREQIDYHMKRAFPVVEPPDVPPWSDCSGFVTICHHAGGAINPNVMSGRRMPWDGNGYTGTLLAGGRKVMTAAELQPGDAVFYGSTTAAQANGAFPVGSPRHVALYVGNGAVLTHGNPGGPEHKPVAYRNDLNCFVTYDVLGT